MDRPRFDPVPDGTWSPVLAGLHAAALDCLQVNLAALADRQHGAGAHLTLGQRLRFAPVEPAGGPPTVAATLVDRLDEAEELLGLQVAARWDGLDAAGVRRLAAAGRLPLYLVGDAYQLPWVPYAGHQHMEHSLLLTGADRDGVTVVDAYHNDTPWGAARPGVWRLPEASFAEAVAAGVTALAVTAGRLPAADPAAALAGNAAAMAEAGPRIARYVAAMRSLAGGHPAALESLVLDVWLLGRSRRLHADWLATGPDRTAAGPDGGPDRAAAAAVQAESWEQLAAHTYLAGRRARRGSAIPDRLLDELERLLRADAALAGRPAGGDPDPTTAPVPPELREVVTGALRELLGLGDAPLAGDTPLRELPLFNSFRLVEVVERIEARLGVQIRPEDLAANSFRDPDALCALFAGATAARSGTAVPVAAADPGRRAEP